MLRVGRGRHVSLRYSTRLLSCNGRIANINFSAGASFKRAPSKENTGTRFLHLRIRHFSQLQPGNAEAVTRKENERQSSLNWDNTGNIGSAVIQTVEHSSSLRDAILTAVVGLCMVFVGGIAYVAWYKKNVLDKIEIAFAKGYDPALELATNSRSLQIVQAKKDGVEYEDPPPHLHRKEQDLVDRIVRGEETGRYFMLLGSKGTGKSTMIFDAMRDIEADGVSMCEAHPDLEVFRLRLGKALNYEYYEDSQTGVFQRRDPREGGAALDIERAMNKLEKVALRCARKRCRPLVLIINNVHFFQHNDEGRNFLLQLQQRAESWAESGILTMVFSSDDFWPFLAMRKSASRMQVLSIYDLPIHDAINAAKYMRRWSTPNPHPHISSKPSETHVPASDEVFTKVVDLLGGRMSHINKVTRMGDMQRGAEDMLANEKAWLLSQIGLIPDCDDDVMDEQKWSSCSWLLLREFVKLWECHLREVEQESSTAHSIADIPVPSIPYWKCRQIMTRPDFLDDLDRANIISIDINHDVRLDSRLLLHAAREVVEEEGFDDILDSVRARVDEIESLHRTRELTFRHENGRLEPKMRLSCW